MKRHQELLSAAIEREGSAQRALFGGDIDKARAAFREASGLYRQSWEAAPRRSYGRLVGMVKSALLAGAGEEEAAYITRALEGEGDDSPTASYARAIAALIAGDDEAATQSNDHVRGASEAFDRTADAIAALAARDAECYATALGRIVRDFEQRADHLTGVPIADTALMLQQLAARRGISAAVSSRLLPHL